MDDQLRCNAHSFLLMDDQLRCNAHSFLLMHAVSYLRMRRGVMHAFSYSWMTSWGVMQAVSYSWMTSWGVLHAVSYLRMSSCGVMHTVSFSWMTSRGVMHAVSYSLLTDDLEGRGAKMWPHLSTLSIPLLPRKAYKARSYIWTISALKG